jgi:hypothetical protein
MDADTISGRSGNQRWPTMSEQSERESQQDEFVGSSPGQWKEMNSSPDELFPDGGSSDTGTQQEEAPYGRCVLCETPYVTYRERDGKTGWKIGKECPNDECPEGR